MCDQIKLKKNNHRRRYTCVKSRERAITVVNMVPRVENILREKNTSTVRTTKNTDKLLNNVTARIIIGKNAGNVTIRVTKKSSSGRNKNITNK